MNWRPWVVLGCALLLTAMPADAQDLLTYYSFDAPPDGGPEAEYQPGDVIADDSGEGRYLRVTGKGVTWSATGRLNGAVRLNGGPGFLKDANANKYLNGLDGFTIMVWVRSDLIGTDAGIINTQPPDDDDQNISLRYDVDGLFGGGTNVIKGGVRTERGKQEYESRPFAQATTWQHLAIVYESGEPLRLVINGSLDDPTYAPLRTSGLTDGNVQLRVGEGAKKRQDIWDGLIDEMRIYDGPMSPPEIRDVMLEELPVELAGFTAATDGRGAVLQWETLSESNNDGFEIEHRAPGASQFASAGYRAGQGTTNAATRYTYRLNDLAPGTHQFRLRQIDLDGTETVYDPVTVKVAMQAPVQVTTYPNPVRDNGTVQVQVRDAADVTVEVYNLLGQRVRTLHDGMLRPGAPRRFRLRAGELPSGTYFVRAMTPAGTTTQRVSVVH